VNVRKERGFFFKRKPGARSWGGETLCEEKGVYPLGVRSERVLSHPRFRKGGRQNPSIKSPSHTTSGGRKLLSQKKVSCCVAKKEKTKGRGGKLRRVCNSLWGLFWVGGGKVWVGKGKNLQGHGPRGTCSFSGPRGVEEKKRRRVARV